MKRDSINCGLTTRYVCHILLATFLIIAPICCFVPENIPSSLSLSSSSSLSSTTRRHRSDSICICISIISPTTTRLAAAAGITREDADSLPLSSFDRKKFHHMRTRGRVMPIIVIGEPIVPGQRLYFRSGDAKFEELIKYIAQLERDYANSGAASSGKIEIGILGFHPQNPGQPLQIGVTAPVHTRNFAYGLTAANSDKAITTSFKGARIFRLVGDPWMDPTGSFHMAHVEIFDRRYDDEPIGGTRKRKVSVDSNSKNTVNTNNNRRHIHTQIESDELFAQIPALVDDWMELMFEARFATPASLVAQQRDIVAAAEHQHQQIIKDNNRHTHGHRRRRRRNNNYALYPPMRQTDRAVWVAALLNPIERYPVPVSTEIRPAFLACRNDRDRLALCVAALRTSLGLLETYMDAKRRGGLGKDGGTGGGNNNIIG